MFELDLKKKLSATVGLPTVLIVLLAIVSTFSIQRLNESSFWVNHTHEVIKDAKNIEAAAVDMETGMRGFLLAGKEEFLEPYKGGQELFYKRVDALRKKVSDNPAQVTLLTEIEANIKGWQDNVTEPNIAKRREVGFSRSMDDIAVMVGKAEGKAYFDKFRGQIATFIEREASLMEGRKAAAEQESFTTQLIIIAGALFTVVAAVIFAYMLIKNILESLMRAISLSETIEKGDLTQRINLRQNDEIGQLSNSLDSMASNLEMSFSKITDASTSVSDQADQLSQSSETLLEDAMEQSSAVDESSRTVDSIYQKTKENAEYASQANEIAEKALELAKEGGEKISGVNDAMDRINKSSQKIASIIQVIEDIAFQTNLLSLNASVEAARAGEQGKGFAVVAEEVGKLASRSAEAAKETSDLISKSVKEVELGNKISEESFEAFNQVLKQIASTNDLTQTITTSSNEQATGIEQLRSGLLAIEKITNTNTDNAKLTAEAVSSLLEQAQSVKEITKTYKLTGSY